MIGVMYNENERIIPVSYTHLVTNCARHAHGSTVWVKIDKNADEYTVQITNDGEVPDKNAEEGGGLSALDVYKRQGQGHDQYGFSNS